MKPLASLLLLFFLIGQLSELPLARAPQAQGAPSIREITTNLEGYPGGRVPRYSKLEISFQVDTSAANLQMPYDPAPPPGVQPGYGVSVDALFTPDGWRTVYTQPAFYYQEFLDQVRDGRQWFYPAGRYAWKVRFAPHRAGRWQFKLAVRDAGGYFETPPRSFSVAASDNPGFVRVSRRDPRYFEFENGDYFPALGYNMNYNHISWENPVLDNRQNFAAMSRNGIQLVRMWLSQWGIYTSAWNPWNSPDPQWHAKAVPWSGLSFEQAYPGSELSLQISAGGNRCMFIGFVKAPPAVRPGADYRVRVRYRTEEIDGPQEAGEPYGFVAKTGGWLWGENRCDRPGSGQALTPYQGRSTSGWQVLEGRLETGPEQDFLPNFYLALENVDAGVAYVDYVWIEEDLGDGRFGPNIVPKPWMAHHLYFEQRSSYAFDKLLELAEASGVYLRPVVLEKNEWIFNRIDDRGRFVEDERAGNGWFYGQGREVGKVRWLQGAWWRYLQARWGYSTSIHSWELLNEGDPYDGRHYAQADEFGKFMRRYEANRHLVSTSFWHSFPSEEFWANPGYPNLDFADVHRYVGQDDPGYEDAALASYELSMRLRSARPAVRMPLVRGEVGFAETDGESGADRFLLDEDGLWLHNFLWAGVNPGGLIESYWYEKSHIYRKDEAGEYLFDHRPHFRAYYNFIHDIPLNNGRYRNAAARVSAPRLRAWGQKDLSAGRAHLWIQNQAHTWRSVLDGAPVEPISGTVSIPGFRPGSTYRIEWWDPYQPDPERQVLRSSTVAAHPDGALVFAVSDLDSDIALKISPRDILTVTKYTLR